MLLAGLVPEGVSKAAAAENVQEFVNTEVQPAIAAEVVSVSRMGAYSDQIQGDRRIRVEFAAAAQAQAVLRAAFYLKAYNQQRKSDGHRGVGIDPFLTKEEAQIKRQLKGRYDQERAPKTFWKGCRLFVKGLEVKS